MTVQELIYQLLAECKNKGEDPNTTPVVIDFGCDTGLVETVNWYLDEDDKFTVMIY